jgi:signal transduction histidine kinase
MDLLGLHYTPEEVRTLDARPHVQDLETDDGRIRLSTTVISPTPKASYLLQVGISLANQDAALRRFLWVFLLSIPAGLIIAVIAGRWMAARALTPLWRLASASRAIDVRSTRRLPVRGTGDELDNVAEAFRHDTLGRLEDAVGELKQFSAALAHEELRTPLAVLRAEAEHARAHPRSVSARARRRDRRARSRASRGSSIRCSCWRGRAGEIPLAKDGFAVSARCASMLS